MDSKRQKRERKLKDRAKRIGAFHEYLDTYPKFVFERESSADPRFVQKVKDIVNEFDFRNLPRVLQDWYAQIKKDRQFLLEFVSYGGGAHPQVLSYMFHMGEYIFQALGESIKAWIPYNDFRAIPNGKNIIIVFGGLLRERGPGGTVYYSAAEPKVKFDDKEYVVGFSNHAIEQTLKRLVARPYSYSGAGDAFAFFNNCKYYPPTKMIDGGHAFTFYDQCAKGFMSWNFVEETFEKTRDDRSYYRRIGYCPVVLEGRFAKAKTLLPPGYSSTPEAEYLNRLPRPKREEYIQIIDTPIANYVTDQMVLIPGNYFDPIKYFHQFIPQVIENDVPLYRHW